MPFDSFFEGQEERADQDIGAICPGIMTGIVKKNYDKDYPGMVQVELLLGDKKNTSTAWLRVMQPYSGNQFGSYFLPEIDTEVVVGFVAGNMERPIVLGCLWNQVDKLPKNASADKNTKKLLVTKGGHQITFDDTKDKQALDIKTPGGLNVNLQDEKKLITVKDEKGENLFTIDSKKGEITLSAKKKMSMKVNNTEMISMDGKTIKLSANDLKADCKAGIALSSKSSAKLESSQVDIKAKGKLSVESSGMAQVKGSMLKLN